MRVEKREWRLTRSRCGKDEWGIIYLADIVVRLHVDV